jgi:hypothetical protein
MAMSCWRTCHGKSLIRYSVRMQASLSMSTVHVNGVGRLTMQCSALRLSGDHLRDVRLLCPFEYVVDVCICHDAKSSDDGASITSAGTLFAS